MSNTIIYGRVASGKSSILKSKMSDHEGKVFCFGFKREYGNVLEEYYLLDDKESNNKGSILNEEFLISNHKNMNKVFFHTPGNAQPYFCEQNIKNFVRFLIKNIDEFNYPILIAFDDFMHIDLSQKMENNKSLFLNLLELGEVNPHISTLFIIQEIKSLNKIYKSEYEDILSLCSISNTTPIESYTGELRLRLPKSLHKSISENADIEGVSQNQYIIYLLTKQLEKESKTF